MEKRERDDRGGTGKEEKQGRSRKRKGSCNTVTVLTEAGGKISSESKNYLIWSERRYCTKFGILRDQFTTRSTNLLIFVIS